MWATLWRSCLYLNRDSIKPSNRKCKFSSSTRAGQNFLDSRREGLTGKVSRPNEGDGARSIAVLSLIRRRYKNASAESNSNFLWGQSAAPIHERRKLRTICVSLQNSFVGIACGLQ